MPKFSRANGVDHSRHAKDTDQLSPVPRVALTTQEAAHAVGCSKRWLLSTDAPRFRRGRKLFWLPDELQEWIRSQQK